MKPSLFTTFCLSLLLVPASGIAYSPETTHAGLTQEVVAYYNSVTGENVDPNLVIKGAVEEDNPSERALNHFYDPIYDMGVNNYRPSYDWALNPNAGNDFGWQIGIDAYAHGDDKTAMLVLGHMLHLIEDASVPDHTRNDPHIGEGKSGLFTGDSPFESWAGEKNRSTLAGRGVRQAEDGTLFAECATPRECFDTIANYSNRYFFSRDTIEWKYGDNRYLEPKAIEEIGTYARVYDPTLKTNAKLYIRQLPLFASDKVAKVLVNADDNSVLVEYFERLTPQTLSVGARVMQLYLVEARFARAEFLAAEAVKRAQAEAVAAAKAEIMANGGWYQKYALWTKSYTADPVTSVIAYSVGTVKETSANASHVALVTASNVEAYGGATWYSIGRSGAWGYGQGEDAVLYAADTVARGANVAYVAARDVASDVKNTIQSVARDANIIQPPSEAQLAIMSNQLVRLNQLISDIKAARVVLPAAGEVAGAAIVANPYILHANSLGGGGGGGGGGTVIFLADTSVTTPPVIPEATTTEDVIIPLDVLSPDAPTIVAPTEFEIIATTSVAISGAAEAGAIVALSWLADTATVVFETRATTTGDWSANILLPIGTTTIGAVAIDEAGNVSSSTLRNVVVELPSSVVPEEPVPVVVASPRVLFNEVAWGGTSASPDDEWIELYNAGDAPADLSRYHVIVGSGPEQVVIPLAGLLGPGNYFVLANKTGALDTEMPETPSYPIIQPWVHAMPPLADSGMELTLIDASFGGDFVVDSIPYCEDWCGKGAVGVSMERWRTELSTDAWDNWDVNDGNFTNGIDRNGNAISGTPGARNSLNYQLSLSSTIDGIQSFAKGQGAYVLFSTMTIPSGSSLSLGAGTVVKWMPNTGKLVVYGALEALGTEDEPVVFTAIDDDTAGGDTLRDGEEPIYRNASMHAITLSGASSTALFVDTEIRYAGTALDLSNHASTTLISTTIADSQEGVLLQSSSLVGEDVTFVHLGGNTIVAFASSTISLASTTVAHNNSDALVVFDSALSLASTTFTQVSGVGIDAFGSQVNATNTVFDVVHVTKNAIDLFDNRRSGKVSTGIFDGVTVENMGGGDVFNMIGSQATVTNMFASGGEDDAITLSGHSTLSISSSTIQQFRDTAILAFDSNVLADEIVLTDNAMGVRTFRSSVDIENSTIEGNTVAGVMNSTPTIGAPLDATENYWGDTNGPTLPGQPAGTAGDSVTVGVLTEPFLETAPE